MAIKMPHDVLEYFRRQGAKGGKIGGKKLAASMTAAERQARASKAGLRSAKALTAEQRRERARKAGAASARARARRKVSKA